MARSLRFWLSLGLSTLVALAVLIVLGVVLGVLLPRLNAEVESRNLGLGEVAARGDGPGLRAGIVRVRHALLVEAPRQHHHEPGQRERHEPRERGPAVVASARRVRLGHGVSFFSRSARERPRRVIAR